MWMEVVLETILCLRGVVSHDVVRRIGVVGRGATGAVMLPVARRWKVCVGLMLRMCNKSLYQ